MPESNYYNRFNSADNYYEVRTIAGKVAQSSEQNEQQSILKHIVKRLGNTLYKNGSIVSGGVLSRNPATLTNVSISEAEVYFDGIIHTIPAASFVLTGVGVENLGIKFTTTTVTSVEDINLKDPATNYPNYGQPGANRTKIVGAWVKDDSSVSALYTFNSNVQVSQPKIGEVSPVEETLARRTRDESGSYTVSGFDLSLENFNGNQLQLKVNNKFDTNAGSKAYVEGREIIKMVTESIPIDRASETLTTTGEFHTFDPANTASIQPSECRKEFFNQPVGSGNIISVIATYDVIRTITNHNFNGYDEIANVSGGETLLDVISVYDSGTVTSPINEYTQGSGSSGAHSYYKSGNGINWNVTGGGSEPTSGSSFIVYALVRKVMPVNDYTVYQDTTTKKTFLDFSAASVMPYSKNQRTNTETSSTVEVSYKYFLPRIDVVYLNSAGVIGIQKGIANRFPSAPLPPVATLALGHLNLSAGGDATNSSITSYDVKRTTMLELRKILARLERAEYNIAVKDLDSEGLKRAGNSISNLRGILTEAFTYSHEDFSKDGEGGISRIKFIKSSSSPNMINVRDREMNLTEIENKPGTGGNSSLVFNTTNTTADYSNTSVYISSPRHNTPTETIVSQAVASNYVQVNSYERLQYSPPLNAEVAEFKGIETRATILASYDSTSPLLTAQKVSRDRTTLFKDIENRNQSGFQTTSSNPLKTYITPTWFWINGTGWGANKTLVVRINGRACKLSLSPSVVHAIPNNFGDYISVTSILGTAVNDIYDADSYVKTSAVTADGGKFTVGIQTPEGLESGHFTITVEDFNDPLKVSHYVVRTDSATIQNTQTSGFESAPSTELPRPVPAKLTAVSLRTTGGSVISDATTTGNLTTSTNTLLRIEWDKTAGTPTSIDYNLFSNGSPVNGTVSSASLTDTDIANGRKDIALTISSATAIRVYLTKAKTAEDKTGEDRAIKDLTVTYNSIAPVISHPVIGSVSAEFNFASVRQDGTINGNPYVGVTWSGLSGSPTSLVIKNISFPVPTPITVSSPAASSTTPVNIPVVDGYNTIQFKAISTGGVSTFTQVVSVSGSTINKNDPIAETFTLDKDRFIEGINLYFQAKPSLATDAPVTVKIVETINGYPSSKIIARAEKSLQQSEVNVNGTTGTTATYFKFPDPVYLKGGVEYAFVVVSSSASYKLWYAKLGSINVVDSTTIVDNPYKSGAMFVSSNDSVWTALQDSDLKFNIVAAKFAIGESLVYFNQLSQSNTVGINFQPVQLVPASNSSVENPVSIRWEYTVDGGTTWNSLNVDSYNYFLATAVNVTIRAKLVTTDTALTPLIQRLGGNANLITRASSVTRYIGKTATYAAYRYVKMIAKMYIPSNHTVKWYISDNTAQPGSVPSYNGSSTYALGDIVLNSGTYYQSLVAGNIGNAVTSTAHWAVVEFLESVVWREIPAAGETKTLQSDGVFYEHERTFDTGLGTRTQFRFRIDMTPASAADTVNTPRVRDIITIVTA